MKKSQNEATVGMFVILGFIILALIVFFISGVYLFRSGYQLNVMYDYVSILDKGAPVRMAGVRIGEVSKVELLYDNELKRTRVKVKLFIEKGIKIRENYQFKIQGTHILSEPHIEITPQPGESPILEGGQTLQGVDPVPVEALVERAHEISEGLAEIVTGARNALKDKDTGPAIQEIILNLSSITRSMETVLSGSEEDLSKVIDNLHTSTDSLRGILDKIEKGEGTAGKLLVQDELYQDMRAFVADVKAHPWKLLKKDEKKKMFFF